MYAIINNGNGDYYTSTVYACYEDPTNEDGTNWWGEYYIVLNKEKNALIKHYAYDSNVKPSIRQMILYIDDNQDNWNVDKRTGIGEVNISDRDSLMKMIEQSTVSNELIELDKQYHFEDYPEIHNEADIAKLMLVSGHFHDARIKQIEDTNDKLHIIFDDVWGCNIEMWFSGDVSYDISCRNPAVYDPYWLGSVMIIANGFIYFIDDEDATIEDAAGDNYCWFKAREVKYHVIPD